MEPPPPSKENSTSGVGKHDDVWDDVDDGPSHESLLDREWTHRQNQFHKMGYRDGITEGQKDSAQDGFNAYFLRSVLAGYKWGRVRGITSALGSLSDSLKEKLVPDILCRKELQDMRNSVQEISADEALQKFQDSMGHSYHLGEEEQITSGLERTVDSGRLENFSKDLMLLLRESTSIVVTEKYTLDP